MFIVFISFFSVYIKFCFFFLSLSISPFGPHMSKNVRARINVRTNTYPFRGFAVSSIESVLLSCIRIHTTGFSKSKSIANVNRRSDKIAWLEQSVLEKN